MSNLQGNVVTWLGHATVLLQTSQGTTVLIDPFLEKNPKYPKGYKLPEKIDLLVLTHGHSDHVADAVAVCRKSKPTVVGAVELVGWLAGKGMENTVGVNFGGSYRFRDLAATMVEAKHSSSIDDDGKVIYAGNPAGFVLTIEGGPTLYHAGDTCAFSDMRLIRELHAPDFVMLPIGDHYTMGPREAALAVDFLRPKTVLPIHFGTWPLLTGTPDQLEKELEKRNVHGVEVLKVQPGEAIR